MDSDRSFRNRITRAKNALKASTGTLEEKIALKRKIKELECEYHNWKLTYFDRKN